ncbi:MAG: hypothetical protein J5934_01290 [Succinivibrio sp.]|nr:hypothetical protein [Succinivibrio sp.]
MDNKNTKTNTKHKLPKVLFRVPIKKTSDRTTLKMNITLQSLICGLVGGMIGTGLYLYYMDAKSPIVSLCIFEGLFLLVCLYTFVNAQRLMKFAGTLVEFCSRMPVKTLNNPSYHIFSLGHGHIELVKALIVWSMAVLMGGYLICHLMPAAGVGVVCAVAFICGAVSSIVASASSQNQTIIKECGRFMRQVEEDIKKAEAAVAQERANQAKAQEE